MGIVIAGIVLFLLLLGGFALCFMLYLRKKSAGYTTIFADQASKIAKQSEEIAACKVALCEARTAHETLTREFHHRVKNSLQIIQSYLTLSRKQKSPPHNIYLAEAEAKVQVISAAYRFALQEGGMDAISIQVFVQEILQNAQTIMSDIHMTLSSHIETDAKLVLDRAIPFGLVMIEAVMAAFSTAGLAKIRIEIKPAQRNAIFLIISVDDVSAQVFLPLRLIAGLQSQLEANAEPRIEGEILHWRIRTVAPYQSEPERSPIVSPC